MLARIKVEGRKVGDGIGIWVRIKMIVAYFH
jgi:hypothetical protein